MKICAVILAGGEGTRLSVLTAKRAKPAVPFAGKFRIIDFVLSNCVNSNVFDVMILAQYRPHSLIDHIGAGGPWELNRERGGGVRIYSPYRSREHTAWYAGTADAVQQNFLFIKDRRPDLVILLSGDHIYRMNYRDMIDFHIANGAEATLATISVPDEEKSRFGICQVGDDGRITHFVEKPREPVPGLGSMGIYVFNYDALDRVLLEDRDLTSSSHDFGKDILPRMIGRGEKVYSWLYKGYWRDVGTLDSYWDAHMDLVSDPPAYDLNDLGWLIHTRSENRSPARFAKGVKVEDALVTHGCTLLASATVERSVLSPGVRVMPGAVIRDSIVLNDVVVDRNAVLERAIVDARVRVGAGAKIGREGGALTVVGKSATIPAAQTIGAGCVIGADVVAADYPSNTTADGEAVFTRRRPHEIR
ncbi:MAG: sugar phosphate nucleotidyltransferase [Sandaracinus sp.]